MDISKYLIVVVFQTGRCAQCPQLQKKQVRLCLAASGEGKSIQTRIIR